MSCELPEQSENLIFLFTDETISERLMQVSHNGQERSRDDTKGQLVDFLENVLEFEGGRDIEFQRVHRLGKQPKRDGCGRMIIGF